MANPTSFRQVLCYEEVTQQNQMRAKSGTVSITVAVNENFSTASFLRKLDQAK